MNWRTPEDEFYEILTELDILWKHKLRLHVENTKMCGRCMTIKPLEDFVRRAKGYKGRNSTCRECNA